jgi:hypothetical protein
MNKMYLALAILFAGCASSLSADQNIAAYIQANYCGVSAPINAQP